MPKIISRFTVSSSTDPQPSSAAALRVYYCVCGEFVLVIDKSLSVLPRRQTDDSIIVRCQDTESAQARVFKLNASAAAEPTLLQREQGIERQYRFLCARCALPVAYQTTPPPVKSGEFLYLLPGALTQLQGQIPKDAFHGESTENGEQ